MTDTPEYTPPEVWVWDKDDSPKWRYGNINLAAAVPAALVAWFVSTRVLHIGAPG
jgi:hypothetical protein